MEIGKADELIDEVDVEDRVIAVVTRTRMRRERLRHRAVFIVVRTSDGAVLVHRRSPDKDLWPGRWDLAVGGVVSSGETPEMAASRELSEEIGVRGPVPRLIGTGAYDDPDVSLLGWIFTVTHDGPWTFDDGEVVEAEVVGLDGLEALLDQRLWVPDSLSLVLPLIS
jgi:8-oxo-dGTP pyrophosphatase MutT (NUDIX family)